ncbi:MAG: nitroreductase family protein [Bacilli bacterium]|nr:nitroreductase family protein [Bacilli bacterium]
MEVINLRRSIRTYSEEPLKKEEIEAIIRAAMQAPSARNQQPWNFLIVQNRELLKKYANMSSSARSLIDAPCAIIFLTDKRNLKTEAMYPQDMSASIENALLMATSLKIGSCWCGIYPNKERMDMIKNVFSIPEYLEPFAIVGFGYPKNKDDFKFVDRFDSNKVYYEMI